MYVYYSLLDILFTPLDYRVFLNGRGIFGFSIHNTYVMQTLFAKHTVISNGLSQVYVCIHGCFLIALCNMYGNTENIIM